jgi:hypothetical protein
MGSVGPGVGTLTPGSAFPAPILTGQGLDPGWGHKSSSPPGESCMGNSGQCLVGGPSGSLAFHSTWALASLVSDSL